MLPQIIKVDLPVLLLQAVRIPQAAHGKQKHCFRGILALRQVENLIIAAKVNLGIPDALAENMPRAVIHLMEQPCRRILDIFILKIGQYQLRVLRFAALDREINRQLQFMVQSRNQIGNMSATPEGKVLQAVAVQKQPRI